MNRRRIWLYFSIAMSALIACLGTWQVTSAFAALPQAPAKPAITAKVPQPDVFRPDHANRTAVGKSSGPHFDKTNGAATEIASLRTRTSKTFMSRGGFQLITYPGSINYKDPSGKWQEIDNTLIPVKSSGYAYENRANSYRVYLPGTIGPQPVEFRLGSAFVRFSLVGAYAPVSIAGNEATYMGALPGVDVALMAQNDQLKETITLSSPATNPLIWSIDSSPGLTARPGTLGSVDFLDRSGKTLFGFAPPFMVDAAGASSASIRVELRSSGTSELLALTADQAWLSDKARQFPVVLDPTVTISYSGSSIVKTYSGANQDCYIVSSSPTTSFCGGTNLLVGFKSPAINRGLLQFNVSIPQDANILEADLALNLSNAKASTGTSVSLYPVTSTWTTAATWNKRDGTNSWTAAGGDYGTPSAWTNSAVGPTSGWYHWYLSSVVQGWVNGSTTNRGVLLRADNESTLNQLTFFSSQAAQSANWPYLKVIYQLGIGDLAWYRTASQQLTDRLQLKENLSSGNLLGVLQLVNIRGTGLNEVFNLNYNILSPNLWDFGRGWITNTGWDQYVDPNMGDGASFFGPTGYAFHYIKNPNGSYVTPPGIDADLVHNGDGTWTVTYHTTQEKLNFTSDGLYMTSDVDRDGNTIRFAYNPSGSMASITDTQGRVTTFAYVYGTYTGCAPPTTSGFVSTITDPANRTYSFTYDANCDLVTYTDPNNKTTTFTYDALFNLTKITDPLANQTNLIYNAIYKVTSVTRVTNISLQTGPTTSFTYNTGNTVMTDPDSNQSTYVYDTRDRVTQVTTPAGSGYTTYTGDNKLATDRDPLSNVTTNTYNASNSLIQSVAPTLGTGHNAATFSSTFNTPSSVNGYQYLPSSQSDAQGNCTAFVYDSAGRIVDLYAGQTSGCDGGTAGIHTSYRYEGDPGVSCGAKPGQLCSTISGNGGTTSYGYDGNGNLTTITPPTPLGSTVITVDSVSRVATVTDGKGQKSTYGYDSLDRVSQILYGGATQCTPSTGNCITYVYDADGSRTSVVDQTGTTTYYYNALNQVTTKALPASGYACAGSSPNGITFTYDGAGNVVNSCDSGGTTIYSYDSSNRLASVSEPGGSCTSPPSLCTTFGYNADGNLTTTTFPGGAIQTTGYDNDQNAVSVIAKSSTNTVLTSFAYTYANGANDQTLVRTSTENDAVASNTYTYSYDALNRLVGALVTSGVGTSFTYSYDSDGNILSRIAGSTTTSYAYNLADQLCWAVVGSSGNPCSTAPSGSTTFTYDTDGNLVGSSGGASFSYNTKNQTSAITANGATVNPITYSGSGQDERVTAGSAGFINEAGNVGLVSNGGVSTYILTGPSGVFGERIGSNHYYFLTDRLRSVVAVISGDGQTVFDRFGYDPYGNTTYSSGSIANAWGYAGGYTDPTGLVKFGARYYDPSNARWTQLDPMGQGYRYVEDNPVNGTDPTGMLCCAGWNGVHYAWNWWVGWYEYGTIWFYMTTRDEQVAFLVWGYFVSLIMALVTTRIGGYWGAVIGWAVGVILGPVALWPLLWASSFGSYNVWVDVYWRQSIYPQYIWGSYGAHR